MAEAVKKKLYKGACALVFTSLLMTSSLAVQAVDPIPNGAPSERQDPADNLSNSPTEENPPMPPTPEGNLPHGNYEPPQPNIPDDRSQPSSPHHKSPVISPSDGQ